MALSPACSRCSSQTEDILHCLKECPHSKKLWIRLGAPEWEHFNIANLRTWIQKMAAGSNKMKFLAGLWGIWKWRNNMILDEEHWSLDVAWRKICHEHDDWCSSYELGGDHNNQWLAKVWEPPLEGWVKLNTDGSFLENINVMGYGGLLRDHDSGGRSGFVGYSTGGNPFISEARALLEGLKLAWSKGFRNVCCEVDSADLVSAVEDREELHFVDELKEIITIIDLQWKIKLRRIPREANGAADCMAKYAAKGFYSAFQVLDLPFVELETFILRDKLKAR